MTAQLSITEHNQTVLDDLEPGDVVDFDRGLFRHYAIYKGGGKVIHKAGDEGEGEWKHRNSFFSGCGVLSDKAEVKEDDFWKVAKSSKARKNNDKDNEYEPRPWRDILKAATDRTGKREGYNVFNNNCENFANECRYGKSESGQGNILLGALGVIATGLVAVVGAVIGAFVFSARGREKNKY